MCTFFLESRFVPGSSILRSRSFYSSSRKASASYTSFFVSFLRIIVSSQKIERVRESQRIICDEATRSTSCRTFADSACFGVQLGVDCLLRLRPSNLPLIFLFGEPLLSATIASIQGVIKLTFKNRCRNVFPWCDVHSKVASNLLHQGLDNLVLSLFFKD